MRDPDRKVWGEPDPEGPHEFEAERLWLVEVTHDGVDAWVYDDDGEFVDEIDAMAHAAHIAARTDHDATHVRVRHRFESEPVVSLSCAVVRHMNALFVGFGQ